MLIGMNGQFEASDGPSPWEGPVCPNATVAPWEQETGEAGTSSDTAEVSDSIPIGHVDAHSPCTVRAVRAMSAKSAAMWRKRRVIPQVYPFLDSRTTANRNPNRSLIRNQAAEKCARSVPCTRARVRPTRTNTGPPISSESLPGRSDPPVHFFEHSGRLAGFCEERDAPRHVRSFCVG